MKILLDAGHGPGENRGSVIGNEGDNMFHFSLIFKKELERVGFVVGLTRIKLTDNPSLKSRGNRGKGYDLFLSLHSNAGPSSVRGCEIFGDLNANDPSLMKKMLVEISRTLKTRNRGIRYKRRDGKTFVSEKSPGGSNWFGVLYHNLAKAGMLVEFCFHTNREDLESFLKNQEVLARNLSQILAEHYGMKNTKKSIENTVFQGVISLFSKEDYVKAKALSLTKHYLILPYDFYSNTGRSSKEWKDQKLKIIAIGGVRSNHAAYADQWIE